MNSNLYQSTLATNHNSSICTPDSKSFTVPPSCIVAHPKWQSSELVGWLKKRVKVIFMGDLGVCDFHPHTKCAAIFISESDLVYSNSLYKTRVVKLQSAIGFSERLVFVECNEKTHHMFVDIQNYIVLDAGLRIFPVENCVQASEVLINYVNSAMRTPAKNQVPLVLHDADVLNVVREIKGIGEVRAKLLLKQFKTIENILNADYLDLVSVLGESSAKSIKHCLSNV